MIMKTIVTLYGQEYHGLDMITRFLALPIFLMASTFLSIWYLRASGSKIMDHFKRGLKAGMIFAVLMALFSGLYYGSIAPDYFERVYDRRQKEVETLLKEAKNAESRSAFKKEYPEMEFPKDKGMKDLIKNLERRKGVLKDQLAYTKPFWVITLNLMVFTVVAIFSSLSIALVGRFYFPPPEGSS